MVNPSFGGFDGTNTYLADTDGNPVYTPGGRRRF